MYNVRYMNNSVCIPVCVCMCVCARAHTHTYTHTTHVYYKVHK